MQLVTRLNRERGLTLEEIGIKTQSSKQAVSKWLNGKSEPRGKRHLLLTKLYREHFPDDKTQYVSDPERIPNMGSVIEDPLYINLPFVSVPARAGFVEMSGQEKDYGIRERIPVLKIHINEDLRNSICIEVDGDSMEPQLRSGDIVLGRLVDRGNWPYMSGGVYAISYSDFFVIKRVKDNNIIDGFLRLYSDNPLGGEIHIPVSQIHYIWQISRGVNMKIR